MKKLLFLILNILILLVIFPGCNENPANNNGKEKDDSVLEEAKPGTAMWHVREMKLAVNIGNSFDSVNISNVAGQTGWGNPAVSQGYIRSLKNHGFTTVRFPVTWIDYIGEGPEYLVANSWMNRVFQVVNWILEEDMYCILNVHHDSSPNIGHKSWIERAAAATEEEEVMAKYIALWKQIAERFNYACPDKLVFEGMNEPQFDWFTSRSFPNPITKKRAFDTLNNLNQVFLDVVRETGSNNATRLLLVPGYWTDIDMTINNWGEFFKMPTDTVDDRIILSLHYYTPWNFCGGNSSNWGSQSDRNTLNNLFNKVKENVIDRGYPVILGEYAVNINNMNSQGFDTGVAKNTISRRDWLISVTQKCINLGICPVLWDTGMRANNKGMADVERAAPFNISEDLKVMINGVVWPNEKN